MSYRSGSISTLSGTSTSRALPRPTGAAVDDILVLTLYVENTTLTPSLSPGSWTKITGASGEQLGGSFPFENHTYWCRQGAESGDITITWGGTSVFNVATAAAYTGRLTSGDPQDGTATYNPAPTNSNATLTCLGITTGHTNADIIAIGSAAVGINYAWAGGLNERSDADVQSWADIVQAGAGASGDKTATVDPNYWSGMLIALREADVVTPPDFLSVDPPLSPSQRLGE